MKKRLRQSCTSTGKDYPEIWLERLWIAQNSIPESMSPGNKDQLLALASEIESIIWPIAQDIQTEVDKALEVKWDSGGYRLAHNGEELQQAAPAQPVAQPGVATIRSGSIGPYSARLQVDSGEIPPAVLMAASIQAEEQRFHDLLAQLSAD